ncbi:MAG: hypothetical protein NVS3B21_35550 [Acidimicrobiales bacterium]
MTASSSITCVRAIASPLVPLPVPLYRLAMGRLPNVTERLRPRGTHGDGPTVKVPAPVPPAELIDLGRAGTAARVFVAADPVGFTPQPDASHRVSPAGPNSCLMGRGGFAPNLARLPPPEAASRDAAARAALAACDRRIERLLASVEKGIDADSFSHLESCQSEPSETALTRPARTGTTAAGSPQARSLRSPKVLAV